MAQIFSSEKKRLCIDLCSGLGGFSRAFIEDPSWEVVTVDIDRKFKPTIQADVKQLPLKPSLSPDVILASPPCQANSMASHNEDLEKFILGLEIALACAESIKYLAPKCWVLENPKGRLRWLVGRPKVTLNLGDLGYPTKKPTDIWTNIQLPLFPQKWEPKVGYGWGRHREWAKVAGRDPSKRALMPLGLSQAILEAVS